MAICRIWAAEERALGLLTAPSDRDSDMQLPSSSNPFRKMKSVTWAGLIGSFWNLASNLKGDLAAS